MVSHNVSGWLKRLKRPALIITVLVLLYAVTGFWIAPYIIKSKLPELLKENIGREGAIEEVNINPFLFKVDLKGLQINKKNGDKFIGFEQLYIDFETESILKQAITFSDIKLVAPYVSVDIEKNGKFNFDDLTSGSDTERETTDEGDSEPVRLWISKLDIQNGQVAFSDFTHPTPFITEISPIDFQIQKFTTYVEKGAQHQFSTDFASGGSLDWTGSIGLVPLHSTGQIKLSGFKPLLLWQYLQDQVQFKISDGAFEFNAAYEFAMPGDGLQLKLSDSNYTLKNFKLSAKNMSEPVIDIPVFSINGINLDVKKKEFLIESITSDAARIHMWVNPDKEMNFKSLFAMGDSKVNNNTEAETPAKQPEQEKIKESKPDSADATLNAKVEPSAQASDSGSDWQVKISELALSKYNILFEDRSLATPVKLRFSPFGATLKDISSDLKGALPLVMEAAVNEGGHLKVNGKLGLKPVSTDVDLDLKLDLTDFQPYIDPVTKLEFGKGVALVKGKVDFKLDEQSNPQLAFNGNASIEDFVGQDKSKKVKLFDWRALKFNGIDFDLKPMSVSINEVVADKAYVRFIIHPDGTTNISRVFASGKPDNKKPPAKKKSASAKEADAVVKIKTVRVKNASAMFADRSLKPKFSTGLTRLNGTIVGVSTEKKARATKIKLKGRADKTAPVVINGRVNLLNPQRLTDIAFNFKNLSLTSLTPYSGKYAGYKIEKGKMSVDLKYKVDRQKLVAENKIVINQLTLGDEVDSPDAVSLPLSLAIALLKDADGVIDLDLPLRGSLKDPKFSIWDTVGDVLVNMVTKIVTAPFAALGNLIGGGDELDKVEFEAGVQELGDGQKQQLGKISDALAERPALRLEIEGVATASDARVDAEKQFRDKLSLARKKELFEELDGDKEELAKADFSISEEQYLRHLLLSYHQKLGSVEEMELDSEIITQELNSSETIAEAEKKLFSEKPVDISQMRALAQSRSRNIREFLIGKGLNPDRIFLLDVNSTSEANGKLSVSKLTLTTD